MAFKSMPRITQEEFDGHDCKLGEEHGCVGCELWWAQKDEENAAVDASLGNLFGSETIA